MPRKPKKKKKKKKRDSTVAEPVAAEPVAAEPVAAEPMSLENLANHIKDLQNRFDQMDNRTKVLEEQVTGMVVQMGMIS